MIFPQVTQISPSLELTHPTSGSLQIMEILIGPTPMPGFPQRIAGLLRGLEWLRDHDGLIRTLIRAGKISWGKRWRGSGRLRGPQYQRVSMSVRCLEAPQKPTPPPRTHVPWRCITGIIVGTGWGPYQLGGEIPPRDQGWNWTAYYRGYSSIYNW